MRAVDTLNTPAVLGCRSSACFRRSLGKGLRHRDIGDDPHFVARLACRDQVIEAADLHRDHRALGSGVLEVPALVAVERRDQGALRVVAIAAVCAINCAVEATADTYDHDLHSVLLQGGP